MRILHQSRLLITMLIAVHLWQLTVSISGLVHAASPLV